MKITDIKLTNKDRKKIVGCITMCCEESNKPNSYETRFYIDENKMKTFILEKIKNNLT